LLVQGGGETPRRLADDRLQVVATLVGGNVRAASLARLSGGSLVAAVALSAAAAGGGASTDLRRQAPLRLGTAADRRRDRSSTCDRLADAEASRDLTAGEDAA
jgi:hypothetical protein